MVRNGRQDLFRNINQQPIVKHIIHMQTLCFQFRPFSIDSWQNLFSRSGLLGYAIIFAALSGKFFDLRSSKEVVSGGFSPSMPIRATFLGLVLFILFGFMKKIKMPQSYGLRMFVLYSIIGILSVLWSSVPIASFGKSLELLAGVFVVVAATAHDDAENRIMALFNLLIYFIFYLLLVVFAGYILHVDGFREKATGGWAYIISERNCSPFMAANAVGNTSVLLLIVLINSFTDGVNNFLKIALYFLLLSATLFFSASRTSIGILFVALSWIIYYHNRKFFLFCFFPLICYLIVNYEILFSFLQGNQVESNFTTLSGRTVLWKASFKIAKNYPFLGLGFGVGSRMMFFLSRLKGFSPVTSTAHNGFLEVFTGVGLVGFLPWLAAFLSGITFCLRNYHGIRSNAAPILGLLPIFIGSTIMSVGVGGSASNELILIFVLMLALQEVHKNNDSRSIKKPRLKIVW